MSDLNDQNAQPSPPPGRLVGEVLLDARGRICGVNKAAEQMIGRPLEQIEGCPVDEAVDDQGLCTLIQYALISSEPIVARVRFRDGAEQEVRVAFGPVDRQAESLRCVLETIPQGQRRQPSCRLG